jgi:YbbR domain-containing protein
VIFGVLVWFSVAMSEQYQVPVTVPLELEGIPAGKAIRTAVPPALQLKLRGTGWQLASLLWASNLRLEFSLQMFQGAKQTITRTDVAERVAARPGIQLVDMSPEYVLVELEREGSKTVPVALDCQVSFKEGYGQVGPNQVTPDSVTVSGAESLLRSVDAWSTVHGAFENVRSAVEDDLVLAPSTTFRLSLSTPRVHVRINVEPFAEKTLSGLPVEAAAVAPNRELILIPPKIDLVVRGGIKQLANVGVGDFRVSVNYRNVLADSSGTVDADVEAPSGMQVVSKKPERLQYVVRKRL